MRNGGAETVLRAIVALQRRKGFLPTFREVAAEAGCSLSNVSNHVVAMRKRGLVSFEDRVSRTLRVTDAGLESLGLGSTHGQ